MLASFSAEMMKLRRRPSLWVLLVVWFLLSLAFAYIIPYLLYQNTPEGMTAPQRDQILASIVPGGWLGNVVSGFPLFGAAMVLIAAVLVVGSEYGWSTVGTVMTQGPGRLQVLAGKLGALALVSVAFELVVFVPGALASAVVGGALDAPADWPSVTEVVEVFAAGFLIFFAWAVLGALLAVTFRGTSLPIGLGLVWLLVIEGLIAGFAGSLEVLSTIRAGLPGANGGSLAASYAATVAETPGVSAVTGPLHAVIVLTIWGLGAIALSALFLRRRDIA